MIDDVTAAKFWSKVERRGPDDCWLWRAAKTSKKYGRFNGRVATHTALELVGKPRPAGMMALHSCDNPPCVNPAHLRWGTAMDNVNDCKERGRINRWRGRRRYENNPRAKLTPENVAYIRVSRENNRVLGRLFGVDRCTIKDIRNGRTWL